MKLLLLLFVFLNGETENEASRDHACRVAEDPSKLIKCAKWLATSTTTQQATTKQPVTTSPNDDESDDDESDDDKADDDESDDDKSDDDKADSDQVILFHSIFVTFQF